MTHDDIIKLAQFAGGGLESEHTNISALERFAALIAAHSASVEREACAKVCEGVYTNGDGAEYWLSNAAAAIRRRK